MIDQRARTVDGVDANDVGSERGAANKVLRIRHPGEIESAAPTQDDIGPLVRMSGAGGALDLLRQGRRGWHCRRSRKKGGSGRRPHAHTHTLTRNHARLEHDPEKSIPVFRKRSCSTKRLERDDGARDVNPLKSGIAGIFGGEA